ncbi:glycoside hydrolase family 3 protein [Sphingomonas gellani]|uniref:glycoside hydrolase family 3 protein n=1 Tax=Sphingomonas gellani TaxID=1166340 RepID=UPI001FCDE684|nr:glycoside hydrolase family 3 N-terminal domain-containing protein [Sphingomonas gellani]
MSASSLHVAIAATLCLGGTSFARAVPSYRDLNHNGRLDPYEDTRRPVEDRLDDLMRRMSVEEKVGTLLHISPPADDRIGLGRKYDLAKLRQTIAEAHVSSLITRLATSPRELAEQNNAVQKLAEASRLGIPMTISTDPRNHFQVVLGASTAGGGFSLWPETLGFAALRDPTLVRRFAGYARREYRAVGIHMALSPQADLATEPRWPRTTATFGSDPRLVSDLVAAYVEGFQGGRGGVTRIGVATVVKHWVGYGAEPDGFDGHNAYGKVARLDNASFASHVAAFNGAFAAHTAGIMPTYPIISGVTIDGRPLEPVGAGFNAQLLGTVLRGTKRFGGFVLSDWAITNDCPERCERPTAATPQGFAIGMPWGVETLSVRQRFAKGLNAGIDQFGGVSDPKPLLEAVRAGEVSMARLDEAVRRVLLLKFQLGLFDNPYVDPAQAARVAGNPAAQAEADRAQRESQVLLENRDGVLPLRAAGTRVWLYKVDPAAARARGFVVVNDPAQAQVAVIRADAPSEMLHPHHFFGSRQNEGRLDFRADDPDFAAILRASAAVPTVVAVNLDRPAILSNVRSRAKALLATFGASDAAVLDVVTGAARPKGRLPFELPLSMEAVRRQDPARPDDTQAPLYKAGYSWTDTHHVGSTGPAGK